MGRMDVKNKLLRAIILILSVLYFNVLTSDISQSSEDFWRQILCHTPRHSSQTKLDKPQH